MSDTAPRWEIGPVFVVSDVPASIAWWRDRMGFEVLGTFKDPPVTAFVGRDGIQVMLHSSTGQIPGANRNCRPGVWDAHIWVGDADALHAELTARGAQLADVRDTFYGHREFEATDPDGLVIAFGSKARA